MRTALTEEFQCGLWKMVATALVLAMRSRLRPDRNVALIGCVRISIASVMPTPPSKTISTEGDTMSRNRTFHPVPRGGIDPIRSADDALAVLALAAPYGHDTIVILLDAEHRGSSIMIVTDTTDPDALFAVIDVCVSAAAADDVPIEAMIVASSRPGGDVEADDVHRWLEAGDLCRSGGLELIEWFVLGRSGPQCPREMFGEPERWAA
jgi:hypothetical protein